MLIEKLRELREEIKGLPVEKARERVRKWWFGLSPEERMALLWIAQVGGLAAAFAYPLLLPFLFAGLPFLPELMKEKKEKLKEVI